MLTFIIETSPAHIVKLPKSMVTFLVISILILMVTGNNYKISVITGKLLGAGTDANVFVILYGEKDTSSQFTLNNKGVNDFERGSTCVFNIFCRCFIFSVFFNSIDISQ